MPPLQTGPKESGLAALARDVKDSARPHMHRLCRRAHETENLFERVTSVAIGVGTGSLAASVPRQNKWTTTLEIALQPSMDESERAKGDPKEKPANRSSSIPPRRLQP